MLTDEQKLLIRQLRADGLPYDRIAAIVGCCTTRTYEVSYDVETKKEKDDELEARKTLRKIKRKIRYIQTLQKNGTLKPCEN